MSVRNAADLHKAYQEGLGNTTHEEESKKNMNEQK
jgi:hypothetical protein